VDEKQADKIVEAINENFEAQTITLKRIAATLERLEILMKLTAATLSHVERKLDDGGAELRGENTDT
jgi:hypothetical protein